MRCGCALLLVLAPPLLVVVFRAAFASPPPAPLASVRLRWRGAARSVHVCGEWDGWARPGVPMAPEPAGGAFGAELRLPAECPRGRLVAGGVCCFRFKFVVNGTRGGVSWLTDPTQPVDTDGAGTTNNIVCAHSRSRAPLPAARRGDQQRRAGAEARGGKEAAAGGAKGAGAVGGAAGGGGGGGAAAALPAAEREKISCVAHTATSFGGAPIGHATARAARGCCIECTLHPRCTAYNWRAEPLANNCALLGEPGDARGNPLSTAGSVAARARTG